MSMEGDICAYIRGRRNKKLAVSLAASVFSRSPEEIVSILQSYGLMDKNKQYIEPVRLTGKEVTMEKKKINYPAFQWSPKRQKKLRELYQAGTSVEEIAAYFETDEDTVYKAVSKYDLVRVTNAPVPAALDSPAQAPKPEPDKTPLDIYRPAPDICVSLKDLLHFIVDASNHNNDTMAALLECDDNLACFELGQQCAKLAEAEKIVKALLTIFPEP